MKTIWKYPLEIKDEQVISVPILKTGPYTCLDIKKQILKLDIQNNIPCLWIMVDSEEIKRDIKIIFCGTGIKCYEKVDNYIDSFQMKDFVFHVFIGK